MYEEDWILYINQITWYIKIKKYHRNNKTYGVSNKLWVTWHSYLKGLSERTILTMFTWAYYTSYDISQPNNGLFPFSVYIESA